MKKTRNSVRYRENCGGILRYLTCGFRETVENLADRDLYEDLRERIFKHDARLGDYKSKEKLAA